MLAFVLINVDIGKDRTIEKKLKKFDAVKEIHVLTGVYDILTYIETDTKEILRDLITWKIRRIPGVRSTLTMIAQ